MAFSSRALRLRVIRLPVRSTHSRAPKADAHALLERIHDRSLPSRERRSMLREIELQHHALDKFGYRTLIAQYGRMRKPEEAYRVLQLIPSKVRVISHYNATISAFEKSRDHRRALQVLREAEDSGFEPNLITYSAAISACEKAGRWRIALDLFDTLQQKGLEPDVITYSAAISACEKGGQKDEAIR